MLVSNSKAYLFQWQAHTCSKKFLSASTALPVRHLQPSTTIFARIIYVRLHSNNLKLVVYIAKTNLIYHRSINPFTTYTKSIYHIGRNSFF